MQKEAVKNGGVPVEKKAKVNFSRPRGSSKFHFRTAIYFALQITSPKTRSAHSYKTVKIVDRLLRPAVRRFTSRCEDDKFFNLSLVFNYDVQHYCSEGTHWTSLIEAKGIDEL